jgi:bifunctional DNase/RNase
MPPNGRSVFSLLRNRFVRQEHKRMQCTSSECNEQATFHLSWIQNRRCVNEEHLCEKHARATLTPYPPTASEYTGTLHRLDRAKQFEIFLVVIEEIYNQPVVYLRAADGPRRVPILIGVFEATSLDRTLKRYESPRPLTHDAMAAAIRLLGGEVKDVVVHRLENQVYYSNVHILRQGDMLSLDVRPSDGFVLAILFDRPIFFTDEVLEQVDRQATS